MLPCAAFTYALHHPVASTGRRSCPPATVKGSVSIGVSSVRTGRAAKAWRGWNLAGARSAPQRGTASASAAEGSALAAKPHAPSTSTRTPTPSVPAEGGDLPVLHPGTGCAIPRRARRRRRRRELGGIQRAIEDLVHKISVREGSAIACATGCTPRSDAHGSVKEWNPALSKRQRHRVRATMVRGARGRCAALRSARRRSRTRRPRRRRSCSGSAPVIPRARGRALLEWPASAAPARGRAARLDEARRAAVRARLRRRIREAPQQRRAAPSRSRRLDDRAGLRARAHPPRALGPGARADRGHSARGPGLGAPAREPPAGCRAPRRNAGRDPAGLPDRHARRRAGRRSGGRARMADRLRPGTRRARPDRAG